MPFPEARRFVHTLGLKSLDEWQSYRVGGMSHLPPRPDDIPSQPNTVYTTEDGWRGYGDWVGNGVLRGPQVPPRDFAAAREFARSLGLKTANEWASYSAHKMLNLGKRPHDIPARPRDKYPEQWAGWDDWLGRS